MKKEVIDSVTGVLTDYKGLQHHITIVAVSAPPTRVVCEEELQYEIHIWGEDCGSEYIDDVAKVLCLGISVCNPEDNYNEKVGYNKALARARNSEPVIYVTKSGIINTTMVRALLNQELQFAIDNPDTIIPGYSETKETYFRNKENEEALKSLNNEEKTVLAYLTGASKESTSKLEGLAKYLKNKQ